MKAADTAWIDEAARIARRRGRSLSEADIEDLAQDLRLRLLARPPRSAPGAWLERLARNLVVDRWRRAQSAGRATIAEDPDGREQATPEDILILSEQRRAVRRGVHCLPLNASRPILLRFALDLDHQAAAHRLGTTPANARTQLSRALRLLRIAIGRIRGAMPGHGWTPFATVNPALAALVFASMGPLSMAETPADLQGAKPAQRAPAASFRGQPIAPALAPTYQAGPPSLRQTVPRQRPVPARAADPIQSPAPDSMGVGIRRFDFDDDNVQGDLEKGNDGLVVIPLAARHPSLIELRNDFRQEQIKSIEDL